MGSAEKVEFVSIEDYLAGELVSPIKHEYIGGVVYAMAGARNLHNLITGNLFATLHTKLRNGSCRPYNSDTKIRIRLTSQVRFYYPDVSVICRPNRQDESFQDEPIMIAEVLSPSTRRIDEGEKKDAYCMIPTLNRYLLVDSEVARVVMYQRTEQGFVRTDYTGLDAIISLTELDIVLPLAELYDGVDFEQAQMLSSDD